MLIRNKKLVLVLVLAAFLRIYHLGVNPPHLSPDEAALGYNAYSILKTGKDEWGQVLPLIFKSFGDYKPGLYVYLTVPFVWLLGLSEFAVRFPSALAGVGIVYLLYKIVEKIFEDRNLALVSAFVASTNPWLIQFSRGAWEVNISLFFTIMGAFLFLVSLTKHKYLPISALFFGLTLLTYQGAKLSSVIVILILAGVNFREFWRIDNRIKAGSVLIGLVVSMPIMVGMMQGKAGRLEVYSVFSYPRSEEVLENFLSEGKVVKGGVTYKLFYSEGLNFTRGILGRWFNHYSPRFLFFEGDWQNPRHAAPNSGTFLLSDLPFLILGLTALIRIKNMKARKLLALWLFLTPLPAILSRDQVHAVRSMNLSIGLVVVIALGWQGIGKLRKKWLIAGTLILYGGGLIYYLDALMIHLPRHDSKLWGYGYKQIVETVTPIQSNYKKVLVQQSYDQPYIYFLFFQKYDPAKWQAQAEYVPGENEFDVGKVEKMDNIVFGPVDWSLNRGDSGSLYVADTVKMPVADSVDEEQFRLVKEIKYLDNKYVAFRIIEIK